MFLEKVKPSMQSIGLMVKRHKVYSLFFFFFTAMITGLHSVIGDETKWRKKIILLFPFVESKLKLLFIYLFIYLLNK